MKNIYTIDRYVARLLMISYFLPVKVPILLIASSLYFLVRSFVSKEPLPVKNLFWALILGSGYFLYLFAIPMTLPANKPVLIFLTQYRSSQLIAPVIFSLISPTILERIKEELVYFSYACFVSCIIGNLAFVHHIIQLGNNFHIDPLSHVAYRLYFEDITGIHPTYMAMYQCFAISILLVSLHSKPKVERIWNLIVMYSLIIFSLSLFAKSPFIALIIVLVHFGYLNRKYLYQYWLFISGIIMVFIATYLFVPFFGQRLNELFRVFEKDKTNAVNNNSVYARKLIWSTDMSMLHDYWLTGVGPGRLQDMLNMRYLCCSVYNNDFPGIFDPHNEYLWQWLAFGITGIIITAVVILIHFIKAIKNKDTLYLYLMLVIAITFSTESVMARQHGVLFYGIFTSMFFFTSGKYIEHKKK